MLRIVALVLGPPLARLLRGRRASHMEIAR
jgi:hypothetical protein